MIKRTQISKPLYSSGASDVYKGQAIGDLHGKMVSSRGGWVGEVGVPERVGRGKPLPFGKKGFGDLGSE